MERNVDIVWCLCKILNQSYITEDCVTFIFYVLVLYIYYKKNPDLQRKFCNGQIYCKTVTDLQQNANKSMISKLQLDCN